ncbi:hypothetical protein GCM10009681_43420 [Luedemannella helvata]|uniref:Uncharacterized protein n=1 Tax=Luedemannella helvata TaxID=349315 RepID=A0ABN2KYQ7_9ACTN
MSLWRPAPELFPARVLHVAATACHTWPRDSAALDIGLPGGGPELPAANAYSTRDVAAGTTLADHEGRTLTLVP